MGDFADDQYLTEPSDHTRSTGTDPEEAAARDRAKKILRDFIRVRARSTQLERQLASVFQENEGLIKLLQDKRFELSAVKEQHTTEVDELRTKLALAEARLDRDSWEGWSYAAERNPAGPLSPPASTAGVRQIGVAGNVPDLQSRLDVLARRVVELTKGKAEAEAAARDARRDNDQLREQLRQQEEEQRRISLVTDDRRRPEKLATDPLYADHVRDSEQRAVVAEARSRALEQVLVEVAPQMVLNATVPAQHSAVTAARSVPTPAAADDAGLLRGVSALARSAGAEPDVLTPPVTPVRETTLAFHEPPVARSVAHPSQPTVTPQRSRPPVPPPSTPSPPLRCGLLVAVSYSDTPSLHLLKSSSASARVGALLRTAGCGSAVRRLVDVAGAGDALPTREAILTSLGWVASSVGPGEAGLVHFVGHGGSDDGGREAVVPSDFNESGGVSDTDAYECLSGLPAGASLLVLCDCRHSGTMVEMPHQLAPEAGGTRWRLPASDPRRPLAGDVLVISTASDEGAPGEAAEEAALTEAFTDFIFSVAATRRTSFADLLQYLQDGLRARGVGPGVFPQIGRSVPFDPSDAVNAAGCMAAVLSPAPRRSMQSHTPAVSAFSAARAASSDLPHASGATEQQHQLATERHAFSSVVQQAESQLQSPPPSPTSPGVPRFGSRQRSAAASRPPSGWSARGRAADVALPASAALTLPIASVVSGPSAASTRAVATGAHLPPSTPSRSPEPGSLSDAAGSAAVYDPRSATPLDDSAVRRRGLL